LFDETATVLAKAIISNVSIPTLTMTSTTADATATVTMERGSTVTDRGFCWNITGTAPTISDNVISKGTGTGIFTGTLTGLSEGPTYYVRGYATNSRGTAYSTVVSSFKICPTFTVIHTGGTNGAPVDKTVTYKSISSMISGASALCWLTQNLGADQQAASSTDNTEPSAGWYFQFNNMQGYKHDGTLRTPAVPAWGSWLSANSGSTDWLSVNDPCNLLLGTGWRIPTYTEWANADAPSQNWLTPADAYNSVLKLHLSGSLLNTNGTLTTRGSTAFYWSATQANAASAYVLSLYSGYSATTYIDKANANALRCVRDGVIATIPTVSIVTIPAATLTATTAQGSATVTLTGGAAVTARGLCWNTTGTPTTTDNHTTFASGGVGSFDGALTGLTEGPTYYVRAYATNSVGTSYGGVQTFKICPTVTVTHRSASGSPVDNKIITYNSVNTAISGSSLCWITKNLGADLQAASASDLIEDPVGWYWQFNRSQGYQYISGGTRTPVAWQPSINENSDWLSANDPCLLELGSGWRLPTNTEWTTADAAPQFWGTAADAYNSVLKLHMAGYISTAGGLAGRGTTGYYWSSTQSAATTGYYLYLAAGNSSMGGVDKAQAQSVRCLRDNLPLTVPILNVISGLNDAMTTSTIQATTLISFDGGTGITARGFCWNTTGNPTLSDNKMTDSGTGTGSFTGTLPGLTANTLYYVRAYATNTTGTGYSIQSTFKVCAPFTVIYSAGVSGAPVTKTVTYKSVSTDISGTLRCWLAQNLGADQQAVSATDATEASSGWYWQFNRSQGYMNDGTGFTPSSTWTSWTGAYNENLDWSLANDPCDQLLGSGWRLPTSTEWTTADGAPRNWASATDTYGSVLKLHNAGYLNFSTGALTSRGSVGAYWSASQTGYSYDPNYGSAYYDGQYYSINNGGMINVSRSTGYPVRCLFDETATVLAKAIISNVSIPTLTMTSTTADATATVTMERGSIVTDRGFCWNITGTAPTISDNVISKGTGTGIFTGTLTGLSEGPTYYVRGYATNSRGTAYSTVVSSFKICPTFTVIHTAGTNGAPVDKTVTYNSISSMISGPSALCWLTQNLGADQQATSSTDNTEPSAGWYFQFNNKQGYKQDGTLRTPPAAWLSANSGSTDWLSVNDPCNLLLGTGWRIPTYTEWANADAPSQNWLTPADAYNSVLKLHLSGSLLNTNGTLTTRGSTAFYWSATQANAASAYVLSLYSGYSATTYIDKATATALRCIKN